jgi:Asp-tRNA(Asn)/Glu-tRNA(Gln) amidotransferase A subunit family amidase
MPTEHGSAIYKDSQPGVDASIVGLLRAAGAIIIGKTVCPPFSFLRGSTLTTETTAEFAAGDIHAATANPFDVTRFAGSSSAGSGAAVADYQCHMALGTQTVSPSA